MVYGHYDLNNKIKPMSENVKHSISVNREANRGKWRIRLFAAVSIFETILFAGIPYGWGALLYVVKDEGIYSDLCHTINGTQNSGVISYTIYSNVNNTNVTSVSNSDQEHRFNATSVSCSDQDNRFNLWFSIALGIGSTSNVIIGYMSNYLSATKTRIIFIPVFVAGALCMAFTTKDLPWMILPGLSLVTVGGLSVLITNIRVASFLGVGAAIYLGLLSGSYDSSSIMTRVVKALYQNGIARKQTFIGLSILHVIISGLCTLLHSKFTVPVKDIELEVESRYVNQIDILKEDKYDTVKTYTEVQVEIREQRLNPIGNDMIIENGFKIVKSDIVITYSSTPSIDRPSLRHHLTSTLYVFHVVFFSIWVLIFVFFLGSVNKRLETVLQDKIQVEYFTDVMAYTLMGGIFGSFISGSLLEWQKKYFSDSKLKRHRRMMPQIAPLSVCGILVISLSALSFVSSPDEFYGLFINLVLFRSFIFSVSMGFITNVFPTEFISVLYGIALTVSGIVGQLQYVLFIWMNKYDGALNHVNGMLLGLGVLSLCHPLNVYIQARRTRPNE